MNIPAGYKDRRKEGDTTLRQSQLVLLHLLYVFDAICKEHSIQYWLAWGSCLGAMRHDGFIPWDDDLDVSVHEKDYKRLLEILEAELPDDVRLQRPGDCPRIAIPFAKIRDVNSFCGEVRPDTSTADPSGLYIDIFPFAEIPDVGRRLASTLIRSCGSTWHRHRYFLDKASNSVMTALWCVPMAAMCKGANLLLSGIVWLLRQILPCSHVCDAFNHGIPFFFKKEWFVSTKMHRFEDGEFPVPVGAEEYLTLRYGDWHRIPPPEKRPRHARIIDPFNAA